MKEHVSKILVKWNMPTRQVVINEIVALFQSQAEDICRLIDDIELSELGRDMEEWREFKKIRNAIRDKYAPVEAEQKESK